jgi:hypothetical protein
MMGFLDRGDDGPDVVDIRWDGAGVFRNGHEMAPLLIVSSDALLRR